MTISDKINKYVPPLLVAIIQVKKNIENSISKIDDDLLPSTTQKSPQLDIFQSFLCNTNDEKDKLSNTIELWDSIPKYAITQQAMNKMRIKEGYLPILERKFTYKGDEYLIKVSPALIEVNKDTKETKAFYPSANEELVEYALLKIASEQENGFFNKSKYKSGVTFSLHLLRAELKKRGHTRSYYEIVRSLNILAKSNIEILLTNGKKLIGEGFATSNYLSYLASVSREKLNENPEEKWEAHFHYLITNGIDTVEFRQYNYDKMMLNSSPLARWLHKKLVHNYTNASFMITYSISLNTIASESGLLDYKRKNDAITKLKYSLEELKKNRVLSSFVQSEDFRGLQNKIINPKYTLSPHQEFIKEVKASNKRRKDSIDPQIIPKKLR